MLNQAVILAGGKGQRLSKLYKNTPKCLVKLSGKPILQHQLEILEREKFSEVIILTHHLSEKIEKFVSSYHSNTLSIKVIKEERPLGTAGSLLLNLGKLQNQFCLIYGDLIFDINFKKFWKFHMIKKCDASLLLHPNDHPKDSDLVEIDDSGRVNKFHKYPHKKGEFLQNLVNAAIYIFNKESLIDYQKELRKLDFGKDIFPRMLKDSRHIYGYESPEYIKDAGTPERLKIVKKHLNKNFVKSRNLSRKRPCIFIDRDGTINEERDHISELKNFKLLPKVGKAIKLINNSNFLAVLITNQPVLARGECNFKELRKIHNKMEFSLSENKAYLDRIYFCPHHPDKGFKGEVKELKINCNCRKPKIGLFKKAINDLNIDLKKSWMIGDSAIDIEAADRLGINSVLLNSNNKNDSFIKYKPTFIEKNLYDSIKKNPRLAMIISKTPLRISFSGGGSDLESFYSLNDGAVLSTSINKYIYVSVNKKFDEKIRLSYSKNEEVSSISNLKHSLVREALDFLKIHKGIEITSIADIPSEGSGLGSSSSFTVGLLNALASFKNKKLNTAKLAKTACKIEIEICKEPIGKQDQYASAFGGFNLIEFKKNKTVKIRPIKCKKETILDLERNIHLFYTGKNRKASLILEDQNKQLLKNTQATVNLKKMVSMTYELESKLNNNDLSLFGEYLHESWMLKKSLSKKISDSFIDEIYNVAINSGAEGGKLLGAGAGGFFLFYAKTKHKKKLMKNLNKLKLMAVTLNAEGSKIIFKDQ